MDVGGPGLIQRKEKDGDVHDRGHGRGRWHGLWGGSSSI